MSPVPRVTGRKQGSRFPNYEVREWAKRIFFCVKYIEDEHAFIFKDQLPPNVNVGAPGLETEWCLRKLRHAAETLHRGLTQGRSRIPTA